MAANRERHRDCIRTAAALTGAGSLLPLSSLLIAHYPVNLWPRSGLMGNSQITDPSPDISNFGVSMPEPASLALLGVGMLGQLAAHSRSA